MIVFREYYLRTIFVFYCWVTNFYKLETSSYYLTVSVDEKYRQAQLGLCLVSHKAKVKMLSQDAEFLDGGSGEEFSFDLIQVDGWIVSLS